MDSITRIKNFIHNSFPDWEIVNFSDYEEKIDFRKDWSELYRINNEEVILIAYTNISITGTDRAKPQLRVFLDEYKKPFYFAKKHQLRFYLFSIFTKEDEMAEYMFLGLRLTKGVSKKRFENLFGQSIRAVYGDVVDQNIALRLMGETDDALFLTQRGLDMANRVMADFLL